MGDKWWSGSRRSGSCVGRSGGTTTLCVGHILVPAPCTYIYRYRKEGRYAKHLLKNTIIVYIVFSFSGSI